MTIHIDSLPNEIILEIFEYLYELMDMINCSYVCKRWRCLALYRLSRVKGLCGPYCEYTICSDIISANVNESEYKITKLLPNLKIIDSLFDGRGLTVRFTHALVHLKQLRAVRLYYPHLLARATVLPTKIHSVNTHYSRRYFGLIASQLGPQLKQLYLMIFPFRELATYAHLMPLLIRLHLQLKPVEPDVYYHGPELSNLQILELVAKNQNGVISLNVALYMLNYCPKLKSAYFCLRTEKFCKKLYPSRIDRHTNLEDLVLIFHTNRQWRNPDYWNFLIVALTKFPNLKHLAIRDNCRLTEGVIIQILERLPNLRILDVRGALVDSETLIQTANSKREKPVEIFLGFYQMRYVPTNRMNPKLDFMRHCFFVNEFPGLPRLFDLEEEEDDE